jgi:hypothetical protein
MTTMLRISELNAAYLQAVREELPLEPCRRGEGVCRYRAHADLIQILVVVASAITLIAV